MRSGDAVAASSTARTAELLADLVRDLVRASLVDAIPTLVVQLVPALVDALARSLQETTSGAAAAKYATAKQAAAMMSCHPATVRRLVREGKLGRYVLGDDVRILVSDIHAYMARSGAASPSIDLAERALAIMGVRGSKDGRDRG
jgi:excisionase family DNA binding protein